MFLATSNPARQLLHLRYFGHIKPAELKRSRAELQTLIAGLPPEMRVLADFSQLDSMSVDCAGEIGSVMELMDQHGVGLIVRVIPDPRKDIGLNILTLFHYKHRPKVATCANLIEAAKLLGL